MNRTMRCLSLCVVLVTATASGCRTDTHADRGALFGGLLGAGTGAIIGNASGHPGAGAAIGAGVGALSGAAIGSGQDEIEAKNRALIEAQLGRQVAPGTVNIGEVVAMSQAQVNDDLIINHIRAHGMLAPPSANDLIALQQSGVSPRVVEAMQQSPPPKTQTVIVREPSPPPVVIGGYYGRPHPPRHRCHVWW